MCGAPAGVLGGIPNLTGIAGYDIGTTEGMKRGRASDQKEAETIADSQAAAARRKRRGKRRFRNTTADAGATGLNIPASGSSVNIPS